MIKEAIILAGGLGTRIISIVNDIPKNLWLKISGKPFLAYLIHFLGRQDINRVVLSVGYKFKVIKDFLVIDIKV